jgi:hypothetical protein
VLSRAEPSCNLGTSRLFSILEERSDGINEGTGEEGTGQEVPCKEGGGEEAACKQGRVADDTG